jgi:hypothetical protein
MSGFSCVDLRQGGLRAGPPKQLTQYSLYGKLREKEFEDKVWPTSILPLGMQDGGQRAMPTSMACSL